MNVVGIIAEYNPMHNGHIYHIKKAKELANADYAIVIMSGSFTEQGNIALINKLDRAKIAIENGADLVIELPTIYAVSSAENFAYGAVNILNSLGIITHLAFGAEAEDILDLEKVASIYLKNKNEIIIKSKEYSKQGINSAAAYSKALSEFLDNSTTIDFSLPNNILAIEYLKALKTLKSQIKPVLVHRCTSCHNEQEIANSSIYASSTSIRNALANSEYPLEQKLQKIQSVIPKNTYDYLALNKFNMNEDMWKILKYEIIKLNAKGLKNIQEVTEGLENKLYKQALTCKSYNEFIFSIKSKRYTLSKIKRICVYILLGITKQEYKMLSNVYYARVLKVKETSTQLLSNIINNNSCKLITKITDKILDNLDDKTKESLKLDILANNLFNEPNLDYTNKVTQP